MSGARQATPAAQEPPANTATVERGKLSDMVSQYGTLTYRARSDGSPYAVINQARGIYTELPDGGDKVDCGDVLYRVNDSPVLLLCGSTPAYRSLSKGDSGPDVAELNANLVRPRVRDPSAARPVLRRLQLRDGVRAREAAVQAGRGSDRVAGARPGGVPARVGADRRGDRRARWIRPAGCTGPVRHIRHARGAGEPRSVAAGRGEAGRPRADHAAGQQVGDGEGRPARAESPRSLPGRTPTPGTRPSRPTSASTTRNRHAGSTRRRSRWRSRPGEWRTP